MLTPLQQENFLKNRITHRVFERVLFKLKGENEASIDMIIDFCNMVNEAKIDNISIISDEFCERVPFEWCEKIMIEILQMEEADIEKYFGNDKIDFKSKLNSFISFLKELKQYETHLLKYDYSVLHLYAKHIKLIA